MKKFQKVYILWSNRDDALPLFIESDKQNINWIEFDEYIKGKRPIKEYRTVNFIVKKPKKMLCDFYFATGLGVVSKRLLELTAIFDSYKKFPVQVNGEDFFMLLVDKVTDCFDVANSVWVKYDEANTMMGSIAEYTFFNDKVDANHEFSIPEYHYMYCTDLVKSELEQKANLGFSFIEIYDVTTGRVPIN
jgi:hypothetical protein